MAFKWDYYLKLANDLVDTRASDQAALRTAVSRAYYAIYHPAKEWAVANGLDPEAKHAQVWSYYVRDRTDSTQLKIATYGDRLKRSRHYADYEATKTVSVGESRQAIQTAEKIKFLIAGL